MIVCCVVWCGVAVSGTCSPGIVLVVTVTVVSVANRTQFSEKILFVRLSFTKKKKERKDRTEAEH